MRGEDYWFRKPKYVPSNYSSVSEQNFSHASSITALFNYASGQDSVLQANKDVFTNCIMESPIARYTDGHTIFTFNQSGPHYFISGSKGKCLNNEKLVVTVMPKRCNRSSNTKIRTSPSPPPSLSSDVIPSPAPAGKNSPPEGTVEFNPTPAPEPNNYKPNSASSTLIRFVNSI